MKVEYNRIEDPHGWKGTYYERVLDEPDYCCKDMMHFFWNEGLVGFGEKEGLRSNKPEFCFYSYAYECWEEHEIKFCPWCGEAIELVQRDVYDVVRSKYTETVEKETTERIRRDDD